MKTFKQFYNKQEPINEGIGDSAFKFIVKKISERLAKGAASKAGKKELEILLKDMISKGETISRPELEAIAASKGVDYEKLMKVFPEAERVVKMPTSAPVSTISKELSPDVIKKIENVIKSPSFTKWFNDSKYKLGELKPDIFPAGSGRPNSNDFVAWMKTEAAEEAKTNPEIKKMISDLAEIEAKNKIPKGRLLDFTSPDFDHGYKFDAPPVVSAPRTVPAPTVAPAAPAGSTISAKDAAKIGGAIAAPVGAAVTADQWGPYVAGAVKGVGGGLALLTSFLLGKKYTSDNQVTYKDTQELKQKATEIKQFLDVQKSLGNFNTPEYKQNEQILQQLISQGITPNP